MGRRKKYNTEEERKAARKAYKAEYYQNNKEKILEQKAEYRRKNKEKILAKNAEYRAKHKDEITAKKAEYYQKNKDEIAEYNAEYRAKNKEKIAEYYKKHKDEVLAKNAEYRAKHKDEITAKKAEYYQKNKDEFAAKQAEYRSTPLGRARNLVDAYRLSDNKYNRGECTIDAHWILDNVFSGQVCHYCGETDWKLLGVDRKDSSLPHTKENCVPCCKHCNEKKGITPYEEYMRMIGKVAK